VVNLCQNEERINSDTYSLWIDLVHVFALENVLFVNWFLLYVDAEDNVAKKGTS